MKENGDIITKIGEIISNYNSLRSNDPNNELLSYIRIEGIGFCILESEKFKERFGYDFEISLEHYYSALNASLLKIKQSRQNL